VGRSRVRGRRGSPSGTLSWGQRIRCVSSRQNTPDPTISRGIRHCSETWSTKSHGAAPTWTARRILPPCGHLHFAEPSRALGPVVVQPFYLALRLTNFLDPPPTASPTNRWDRSADVGGGVSVGAAWLNTAYDTAQPPAAIAAMERKARRSTAEVSDRPVTRDASVIESFLSVTGTPEP